MARNTNSVIIVGRATADAESKKTANGKPVANFSIANNRDYGETERTNFIPCRVYGELAEKVVSPYVKKGTNVLVAGELCVDKYEKDGNPQTYTYVLVTNVEFLSPKKKEDGETTSKSNSVPSFSPYEGF